MTPIHSKLITKAGRAVLRPMGLTQKGRSRIWLDDHGWWVCVVEFQPREWSRGSYLNVGCMWLWGVKDYISFDEGHQVGSLFIEFHDEEQFEPEAKSLAERAAQEVQRYRKLFPSVGEVCNYYVLNRPYGFWPSFHAGVACALAGQPEQACRFFERVTEVKDDHRNWLVTAQAVAEQLTAIAADTEQVRQVIAEKVCQTRQLQKLTAISAVNFDG